MPRAGVGLVVVWLALVPVAGAQEQEPVPVDCASIEDLRGLEAEQPLPPEPDDQVIADDLIVDGRTCVGLTCANNEVFATEELKLKADTPELRLAHSGTQGSRDWAIRGDESQFRVVDVTAGTTPFAMRNGAPTFSLNVFANGTVAVGGGSSGSQPSTLQVHRADGTAKLLVEEASTTTASRNLLRVVNNGAATFRFDNTFSSQAWGFGALGSGNFFIGSSPGQALGFTLSPSGDVTLTGTLTQSSDRNAKQGIVPVEPQELLERVARLPLATWEYKGQDGVRHLGPMAQDFAAAFSLGADNLHLAPGDVAGVSLAAIQALKTENDRLRATQGELAARLEALAEELRALRQAH